MLLIFLSWSGRHTCWGQPFRLCHMTTGRYLGLTQEKGLHLVDRDQADINTTSFCFRSSKVRSRIRNTWNLFVAAWNKLMDQNCLETQNFIHVAHFPVWSCEFIIRETHCLVRHVCLQEKPDTGAKTGVDGMGIPEIKYGDSICYVQHVDSGLWLTYQAIDAKSTCMGMAQRKVIF